jgi:hypothetical protein
MANEEFTFEEKERFDGTKVKVLMPQYGPSPDEDRYQWRMNIEAVNVGEGSEPLKAYLSTAERYFMTPVSDWFGSERRKNPV